MECKFREYGKMGLIISWNKYLLIILSRKLIIEQTKRLLPHFHILGRNLVTSKI